MGIHPENRNVYKIVRARSYYHCGKACRYATKCEYWTYRYHERKCYLLKSCCKHHRKGFLSGDQYCPPTPYDETRSLDVEDYDDESIIDDESFSSEESSEEFSSEESFSDEVEDYSEESD